MSFIKAGKKCRLWDFFEIPMFGNWFQELPLNSSYSYCKDWTYFSKRCWSRRWRSTMQFLFSAYDSNFALYNRASWTSLHQNLDKSQIQQRKNETFISRYHCRCFCPKWRKEGPTTTPNATIEPIDWIRWRNHGHPFRISPQSNSMDQQIQEKYR